MLIFKNAYFSKAKRKTYVLDRQTSEDFFTAMKHLKRLQNVPEMQAFLGKIRCYCRFTNN